MADTIPLCWTPGNIDTIGGVLATDPVAIAFPDSLFFPDAVWGDKNTIIRSPRTVLFNKDTAAGVYTTEIINRVGRQNLNKKQVMVNYGQCVSNPGVANMLALGLPSHSTSISSFFNGSEILDINYDIADVQQYTGGDLLIVNYVPLFEGDGGTIQYGFFQSGAYAYTYYQFTELGDIIGTVLDSESLESGAIQVSDAVINFNRIKWCHYFPDRPNLDSGLNPTISELIYPDFKNNYQNLVSRIPPENNGSRIVTSNEDFLQAAAQEIMDFFSL